MRGGQEKCERAGKGEQMVFYIVCGQCLLVYNEGRSGSKAGGYLRREGASSMHTIDIVSLVRGCSLL